MPVTKQDADHALSVLQGYHEKLTDREDEDLRNAIENIMDTLNNDLFGALIDIQEVYALMTKPLIEKEHPKTSVRRFTPSTERPASTAEDGMLAHYNQNNHHAADDMYRDVKSPAYEYENITLERGSIGLGFSIAGGRDNPLEGDDPSIYITKILPSGAAAEDGRLRVNDAIIYVNGINTMNVEHKEAVEALKLCQTTVRLVVRRLPIHDAVDIAYNGTILEIVISKGMKGLGFTIAGGIGNEHVQDDHGIFITKIIKGGAAEEDGRLQPEDKILEVDGISLQAVNHDIAVSVLKSTKDTVALKILRREFGLHVPEFPQTVPHNDYLHGAEPFADTSLPVPIREFNQLQPSSMLPHDEFASSNTAPEYSSTSPLLTKVHSTSAIASNDLSRELSLYTDHDQYLSTHSGLDQDIPRGMRSITLCKGPDGLGINIVGGDKHSGVFISNIHEGGVAEASRLLYKGDHILTVNNVDVSSATHDEAINVLKSSSHSITMEVQYKPEELREIAFLQSTMNKSLSGSIGILTSQKKTLHVRALFDYDSSRDSGLPGKGLSFQLGDILHVTNASDDEWWQARRVESGNDSMEFGVIPSKSRVERKERARLKQVKFTPNYPPMEVRDATNVKRKKSLLFSRKFPFYKSRENLDDVSDTESNVLQSDLSASDKDISEETVLSYEKVTQKRVKYARPVVLLGPFKDRINDDLIAQEPEKFGSCVPHTTREKRDNEEDGRDYHFVTSREQMEKDIQDHLFIEAGQYNENLYGTSIQSVRDIAESNKNCILDVSGSAIKRLQEAELWPVAIFIKPKSVQWLMELNKRLVEEQALKIYDRAVKVEQEYGEHFTVVVQGDSIDELYDEIKRTIHAQSGPVIWIPATEENS